MARIANSNLSREDDFSNTSLVRYEDANVEAIRKKYAEEVEKQELAVDQRSVEEIQAEVDAQAMNFLNEFLELEDEVYVDQHDPYGSWKQFSSQMKEELHDVFEEAHLQREQIAEEEAADRIEQVETFSVNEKDPFLEESFKQKSERMIKKMVLRKEQEEGRNPNDNSDSYTRTTKQYSTADPFGAKTYYGNTRETKASTQTFDASGDQQSKSCWAHAPDLSDKIKQTVVNGGRDWNDDNAKPIYYFGGKGKFKLKYFLAKTKNWFRSKKGRRTVKMGMALCLETALAVITHKMHFDGNGQALAFIGMMLGLFYISNELWAEGYDPRRIKLI